MVNAVGAVESPTRMKGGGGTGDVVIIVEERSIVLHTLGR